MIPAERLPAGFAEQVDAPPEPPAPALPAATAVLMRDAEAGPEVLLLRRSRDAGFVPGAYVFPGGRVDAADGEAALRECVDGLPANVVSGVGSSADTPGSAYWIAAAREVFEETGILLAGRTAGDGRWGTGGGSRETAEGTTGEGGGVGRGRGNDGGTTGGGRSRDRGALGGAASGPTIDVWRDRLLEDRATLLDMLRALGARLDLSEVVYCAHWITPTAERRRYDTRFFLARVSGDGAVRPDAREMTDALWLRPAEALDRFAGGALPMVFPTVKTLESLTSFTRARQALEAFRRRRIEPVLPRLVRTATGVGIIVDVDGPSSPSSRSPANP